MKNKFVNLAIISTLLLSLSACTDDEINSSMVSTTPTPEITNTQSEVDSTETVYELNVDLLSDFGSTFDEIKAKRGKLINAFGAEGGVCYSFENGFGNYAWGFDKIGDGSIGQKYFPKDESGNLIIDSVPLPMKDVQCYGIDKIPIEKMFLNIELPITITELESKYNVNFESSASNGIGEGFYTSFSYNDKILVTINSEKTIDGLTDRDVNEINKNSMLIDENTKISLNDYS